MSPVDSCNFCMKHPHDKKHLEPHLGQETPGTVRLSVWNVDRHGQCSLTWFSDIMFGKNKVAGNPFSFLLNFFFLTNLGWFMVQNKLNLHSSGLVSWVGLSLVCFAAGQWGHIVQGIRWSPYDSIVEDVHPFLKISYFSKGLVKNHQLGFDSIYFHLYGDLLRDVGICHVTT